MTDQSDIKDALIVSSDGAHFWLSPKSAAQVGVLKTNNNEMLEVPFKSETIGYVTEFLRHHKNNPFTEIAKPIPMDKKHMEEIVADPWDAKFINSMETETLTEVLNAANHLQVEGLVHLGAAKLALSIRGKTPAEIIGFTHKSRRTPDETNSSMKVSDDILKKSEE